MPATHVHIDGTMHVIVSSDPHPNEREGHKRVVLGCGMTVDTHAEDLSANDRWKTAGPAECPACSAVEAGEEPIVHPTGFNPPAKR